MASERLRALLAFGCLMLSSLVQSIAKAIVHDRVPVDKRPLPDLTHELIDDRGARWMLPYTEWTVATVTFYTLVFSLLHRHRWILLRRAALIAAVLYCGRAATMMVTALPPPDYERRPCSAQFNATNAQWLSVLTRRVASSWTTLGLTPLHDDPTKQCGDYIYR